MMARLRHIRLCGVLAAFVAMACALPADTSRQPAQPFGRNTGPAEPDTYRRLHRLLDAGGSDIDYDTLTTIYRGITEAPAPVAHVDRLLAELMQQRNANPRVDQMILIYTARAIGGARYPIAHADQLLTDLLGQDDRLNEWVLSFIAEAIASYPVDLANGDRLADLLEEKHRQVKASADRPKEFFGYHFLPPPKTAAIEDYLSQLTPRHRRETERAAYYRMISQGISETQIAAGLAYLRSGSADIGDLDNRFLMNFLIRHWGHLPVLEN